MPPSSRLTERKVRTRSPLFDAIELGSVQISDDTLEGGGGSGGVCETFLYAILINSKKVSDGGGGVWSTQKSVIWYLNVPFPESFVLPILVDGWFKRLIMYSNEVCFVNVMSCNYHRWIISTLKCMSIHFLLLDTHLW